METCPEKWGGRGRKAEKGVVTGNKGRSNGESFRDKNRTGKEDIDCSLCYATRNEGSPYRKGKVRRGVSLRPGRLDKMPGGLLRSGRFLVQEGEGPGFGEGGVEGGFHGKKSDGTKGVCGKARPLLEGGGN